jgi:ankyrin repeat protein
MDKMNEAKTQCLNKENVEGFSKEFKKSLILKRSKFNSIEVCIKILINNDYKFSRQFSADNLIKFKDVLSISNFLIQKTKSTGEMYDLDATLVVECDSSRPNLELLRLLIDGGANINAWYKWDTALFNASSRGHEEVVRLLLDQGAAINAKGGDSETALMEATRNGHLEVVKLLLDYGADLNNKDTNDETPLIMASKRGNLEMVELLLKKRAVENKYKDVVLALGTASRHGQLEIVKLILNRDGANNAYDGSALVGNRNLEVARVLLDHSANGKYIDKALIKASREGDLEIVKLLIEKRADINAKEEHSKRTPLIEASSNGHFELVKLLLNNGADANAQDKDGLTALLRFYFLAFHLDDSFVLF